MSKEELVEIFGQDLFTKKELLQIYKELLGTEAFKPFDCVGTPEEVKVAFYLASQKGEYKDDIIMKFFEKEILPGISDIQKLQEKVFTKSNEHRVPEEFLITQ